MLDPLAYSYTITNVGEVKGIVLIRFTIFKYKYRIEKLTLLSKL